MDNALKAIKQLDISILFIEHDMDVIRKYSKRVVAFYSGKIISDDETEVAESKDVLKYIVGHVMLKINKIDVSIENVKILLIYL